METQTKVFHSPKPSITLKSRLEQELPKEPGQVVKAFNVYGKFYRVNWICPLEIGYNANPKKTGQIVKSQFLFVEVEPNNSLVIEDKTLKPTPKLAVFL